MKWRAASRRIRGIDRHGYWAAFFVLVLVSAAALLWLFDRHAPNRASVYDDPLLEFKYGSIGSDIDNGLPRRLLAALPRLFPEYLPDDDSPRDYRAFGLLMEPGRDLPIGFSRRQRFIELSGLNCAICHTGRVITPGHPQGQVIPGMPSNTVDLQAFFLFLFRCAEDWRFNPDYLIGKLDAEAPLDTIETVLYRLAIPLFQGRLLARKARLKTYFGDHPGDHPRWGPGRVDTFDTFKFDQFASLYHGAVIPDDELYGTVDFPPIWAQDKREGLSLHWDGNNDSVRERNFSAALAAGASAANLDAEKKRLFALMDWIASSLKPPAYPFPLDTGLAERGKALYARYCFDCHDFAGRYIGQVTPLTEIGTDRGRLDSYTRRFSEIQRDFTRGHDWAFTHFRKTDGYANMPLDGIWARAPYLHNGSVPTLAALLKPAAQRPSHFYLGDTAYLPGQVGFRHDRPLAADGRRLFLLETGKRGNGNRGHNGERYGTGLADDDKAALLEYLKTL